MTMYNLCLILFAVILCGLTNLRISLSLARKWSLSKNDGEIMAAASTAIMLGISGVTSAAAIECGGNLFGAGFCIASIPFVVFLWAYVIGTFKVCERILVSFAVRLD